MSARPRPGRERSSSRVSDPRARLASARLPVRNRASALPFLGRRPCPGVNADPAGLPLPLPEAHVRARGRGAHSFRPGTTGRNHCARHPLSPVARKICAPARPPRKAGAFWLMRSRSLGCGGAARPPGAGAAVGVVVVWTRRECVGFLASQSSEIAAAAGLMFFF